jgi:hypothetical protein
MRAFRIEVAAAPPVKPIPADAAERGSQAALVSVLSAARNRQRAEQVNVDALVGSAVEECTDLVGSAPLLHRDGRSLARLGHQVNLVHEPLRSPESDSKTSVGPVLLSEHSGSVEDARAFVSGNHRKAGAPVLTHLSDQNVPFTGVHRDVSGDL